jgi:hypothetical protein
MASTAELTSFHYAAGCCRLDVSARVSPLSQVAGKPVLRQLRFHLQLGDPQVILELQGMRSQLLALQQGVDGYLQHYLGGTATTAPPAVPPVVQIQPRGLTRHRLQLHGWGADVPAVDLSSRQLNDLAQVLGQLQLASEVLPQRLRSHPASLNWRWAGTAAAVLLAVGGFGLLRPWLMSPAPVSQSPTDAQVSGDAQAPPAAAPEPPKPQLEAASPPPQAAPQPTTTAPAPASPSPPPRQPEPAPTAPSADSAEAPTPFAASAPTVASAPPSEAAPPAELRSEVRAQPWLAALEAALTERWRPPESLQQPLEYWLLVNTDGQPQRLEPISDLAANYANPLEVSDIQLPPPSVTPAERLRLVLFPDGALTLEAPAPSPAP